MSISHGHFYSITTRCRTLPSLQIKDGSDMIIEVRKPNSSLLGTLKDILITLWRPILEWIFGKKEYILLTQ
jgi:hypothetical protein